MRVTGKVIQVVEDLDRGYLITIRFGALETPPVQFTEDYLPLHLVNAIVNHYSILKDTYKMMVDVDIDPGVNLTSNVQRVRDMKIGSTWKLSIIEILDDETTELAVVTHYENTFNS